MYVGVLDGARVGAEGEYVGASIITVVDGNAVGSRYVTDLNSNNICTMMTNMKPKRIVHLRGDNDRCDRVTVESMRSNAPNRPENIAHTES